MTDTTNRPERPRNYGDEATDSVAAESKRDPLLTPPKQEQPQTVAQKFAAELTAEHEVLSERLSEQLRRKAQAQAEIKTLRAQLAENERTQKALQPRASQR